MKTMCPFLGKASARQTMAQTLQARSTRQGRAWVLPVLLVVPAVVALVIGSTCGARASSSLKTAGSAGSPSAPPGPVFMVMWTLLYLLVGAAAGWQAYTASSPAHWTSLALLAATVVVSWAWPTVWAKARPRGPLPGAAPVWVIGAMLLVGGTALTLVPNSTSAALWAPYILWLFIALGLAMQANFSASASASGSASG